MVFITDAALDVPAGERKKFETLLGRLKDENIRCLWIGIGSDLGEKGFKQAAAKTGGSYVITEDPAALTAAFTDLTAEIRNTAAKLKGTGPVDTARRIYDWIGSNVEYVGYTSDDRGALYAVKNRRGDCTEFMYLFVALARANGIPARGVGGYVVDRDTVLEPHEYHNWAEFYLDGVWHVADPQRSKFMDDETNYIAMRIIGGDSDRTPGKFHRFWCSSDSVTVRMNRE